MAVSNTFKANRPIMLFCAVFAAIFSIALSIFFFITGSTNAYAEDASSAEIVKKGEDVTFVTLGKTYSGEFRADDESMYHYYKFEVPATGSYMFKVESSATILECGVFDDDGYWSHLWRSYFQDKAGRASIKETVESLEKGSYYLAIGNITVDDDGWYTFSIEPHVHNYSQSIVEKATLKQNGFVGKACNCGKINKELIINRIDTVELKKNDLMYNGKIQQPSFVVKDSKGKVIPKSQYRVSYSKGCRKVGTYKASITFTGSQYKGSASRAFTITKGAISKTIFYVSFLYDSTWRDKTISKFDVTGDGKKDNVLISYWELSDYSDVTISVNGKQAYYLKDSHFGDISVKYLKLSNGIPLLVLRYKYGADKILVYKNGKFRSTISKADKIIPNNINNGKNWTTCYISDIKAVKSKVQIQYLLARYRAGSSLKITCNYKYSNGKLKPVSGNAGSRLKTSTFMKRGSKVYSSASMRGIIGNLSKSELVQINCAYIKNRKLMFKVSFSGGVAGWVPAQNVETYYR